MDGFRFRVLSIFLIISIGITVWAQDGGEKKEKKEKLGWNNNVVGSLNLTQTNFDNWSQGGENSVSWQFNFNAKFEKNEKQYNWNNSAKISYGKLKVGSQSYRKSVDEIRLETVYTYKLDMYVNPYASATGETQFSKGYIYSVGGDSAISDFMDPGYFTQSVGLGYSSDDMFKTRLGAALRETVTKKYNQYSNDPDTPKIEKTKVEVGIESVTDFSFKLSKNLLFTTNLRLFSNLVQFKQMVVRWDNVVTASVAKYVDVNFNYQIFYDRTVSPKRQIKEALALGLTYTFL